MEQNFSEIQYGDTKKSKFKKYYEANKKLIFALVFFLIFIIGFFTFSIEKKKREKILLSENYIQSQIYLDDGKRNSARKILKEIIFENDDIYSILSLFSILDESLVTDPEELIKLFDHILKNNKFDEEFKNLLIYKKALIQSNFSQEAELLELLKPLINQNTVWKPHALLLAGDYFSSKKENSKAKEFYLQVLSISDLQQELYQQAGHKASLITND